MIPDKAYKVVSGDNGTLCSGDNGTLCSGDIVWVDSAKCSLCVAGGQGGWLDRDEIDDEVFAGVEIEEAPEYEVRTWPDGTTRLERV